MVAGQEFSTRSALDDALGTDDIVNWDQYVQRLTLGLDQYRLVDLGQ